VDAMHGSRALGRLALAPATAALAGVAAAVEGMGYAEARSAGRALGRIWYHALPIRRATVTRAIRAVFPTWSASRVATTAERAFCQCAANVTTLLWATGRGVRPGDILDVVRFVGFEHWEGIAPAGAVIAASHTGNWDMAALAAAARGVRIRVVSRNLRYGPLDRMWNTRRTLSGVDILDESAGLGSIMQAAAPGCALAILVDQRTGPDLGGIRVPFLGREAWTTTLPAAIALRKGLPVLPVASREEPDGTLCVNVGPALAPAGGGTAVDRIRAMTATLQGLLGDWVWQYPDSWLWLHRRWEDGARDVKKITPGRES